MNRRDIRKQAYGLKMHSHKVHIIYERDFTLHQRDTDRSLRLGPIKVRVRS